MSAPTRWVVLENAHRALVDVVARIGPDEWGLPTPCEQWNVAQVVRHAAGDQAGYAAMLTGTGWPEEDPFAPSPAPPVDASVLVVDAVAAAAEALGAIPVEATDVPNPLPLGPLDAPTVVGAAALDAAVHAWDVAVAIGAPSPLGEDLAADLADTARQIVDPLRGFAYAASLDARDGDAAAARLLRHLGRDPGWARAT